MSLLKQVTLDRINRKKDRSISMTFITQLEQSSIDLMQIDELVNDSGVIYFKSSGNLTQEEITELENVEVEVEGKTKSQRLRNVLYIYHKQTKSDKSFNDFYADEMERIIKHFRNKLDSE